MPARVWGFGIQDQGFQSLLLIRKTTGIDAQFFCDIFGFKDEEKGGGSFGHPNHLGLKQIIPRS